MADYKVIGTSQKRYDAVEKVTGAAIYSGDIKPDRMCYGRFVASPHAHANILSIDTSEAEAMPNVVGIITGADVPEKRYGGYLRDRHILCKKTVRFVGDYVALVVATDEVSAANAAAKVKVEYEVLPAIFDVEDAASSNPSVIVHPNLFNYSDTGFQGVSEYGWELDRPNQFTSYVQKKGDIEKGFAESDIIIENRYTLPFVSHCTMETHQCVVAPRADGGLDIWGSEQKGGIAKYEIAEDLEIDPAMIHFHTPYLGGGFGGKTGIPIIDVACVAALKFKRPVRISQTREENFIQGGLRGAAVMNIKDGYKKDGTLVSRFVELLANSGGYAAHATILVMCAGFGGTGNYRCPNQLVVSRGIYTNLPINAPYRALGSEYFVVAIERNMDEAARKLGIGRDEIRLKNVLRDGDRDGNDKEVFNNASEYCLKKAIEGIHLEERRAPEGPWRFGKSVSLGNKFVGTEDEQGTGALVKVNCDGSVTLYNAHVELGQGAKTVDAMAVAETLKMPYEMVHVFSGDSELCPHDMGTFCSRGTFVNGNAAILASLDAKKKILHLGSKHLNVPEKELDLENMVIFEKANPENSMKVSELFSFEGGIEEGGDIIGGATWHHPYAGGVLEIPRDTYSYGSWGMEVGVNIETGEVKITKLIGCYDGGTIVNPTAAEAQIEGAFSMGFGQALFEHVMVNDQGKMINCSFRDYKVPTFMDSPSTKIMDISFAPDNPNEFGPHGAKGIGEVSTVPVLPGIANAVSDAIGIELYDLPFTRETIVNAINGVHSDFKV